MLKSKNKIYSVNRRYYFTVLTVVIRILSVLLTENRLYFVGFVGRNRYRVFADSVFKNRLTDGVLSSGNLPTNSFLRCSKKRIFFHLSMRPILNYHSYFQNRGFVGFVGKKQILLSGGVD